MGGTPTDPVATPANFAFGALRCGVDNLNGDNVEWVTFPTTIRIHVFCFAYYVTPPPPAGTIIVRKRLSVPPGGPDVPPQTFRFTGNHLLHAGPGRTRANPQSNYFNISGGDSDAGGRRRPGRPSHVPRDRRGPFRESAAAVVLGDLRQGGVHVLEQAR